MSQKNISGSNLAIHEEQNIRDYEDRDFLINVSRTKVVNGWLYRTIVGAGGAVSVSTSFVPDRYHDDKGE